MAEYIITIRNEGGGSPSSTAPTSTSERSAAPTQSAPASQDSGGKAALRVVASFDIAKRLAFRAIDFRVNTVQLRTGSAAQQERYQYLNGVAQNAFGMIESIAVGYAIGNLPGAVIGGISSVASMGISYLERSATIDLSRQVENETIRRNDLRAGATAGRNAMTNRW